jgi:hypothetical protein
MQINKLRGISKHPLRADKSAVIGINLSRSVAGKDSPVMLSAAKHLGPARQILRCAQHDSVEAD